MIQTTQKDFFFVIVEVLNVKVSNINYYFARPIIMKFVLVIYYYYYYLKMMSKIQWFVLLCLLIIYILLGAVFFHELESRAEFKRRKEERIERQQIEGISN